ncbi:hypothetical protein GUITHDRAFT_102376 [Guillardia theta CCMP2712]|uniref:RWP-RK domain-containing protein n=1 Tax=Guillardia theta (strain CCMP2712) TaxID=905079 RepID=L1JU08_GUITC|nr:hypothetical protein GUITHDRAFT_102376 [Guillardia theta CCMP2712]EKX51769.1 hypothetical protein GUITHDRAFT_102376 [Guillardia theta CCMP2712]|eukprot:XP_005838749.1 hypothetical protein GUITHDRAFT_102376 [Guillardia theta CCMP2712]
MHNLKSLREILSENGMSSGLESTETGICQMTPSLMNNKTVSSMSLLHNSYILTGDSMTSDHEKNFWLQRQAATSRPMDVNMDSFEKSSHEMDLTADTFLQQAAYINVLAQNPILVPGDFSQRIAWAGNCGLDNSNKHFLSNPNQTSFMSVLERATMIGQALPESQDPTELYHKYKEQIMKQESKIKEASGSESSEHEDSVVLSEQASSDDISKAVVASVGRRRRRNATDDVTIFPRRKAGQDKLGRNRPPIVISLPMLQRLFDLPQRAASKKLGICTTVMKKVCRRLGVCKWPYKESKARKLSSAVTSSD